MEEPDRRQPVQLGIVQEVGHRGGQVGPRGTLRSATAISLTAKGSCSSSTAACWAEASQRSALPIGNGRRKAVTGKLSSSG